MTRDLARILILCGLWWLVLTGTGWSQEAPGVGAGNGEHESERAAEKFSQAPTPTWVAPVQAPAAVDSQEPQTVRLGDVQIRATAAGETLYAHYMLRANNAAGVSALGQLTIDFNPAFQDVVLHSLRILRGDMVLDKQPGLKVRFLEREPGLENSIYTGIVTIAVVMDDLRIGDTIEYSYSLVGTNPVFKGVIAGSSMWQSIYPVQLRRVSIQMPANRKINYRFMGASRVAEHVTAKWTKKEGYQELLLEQRDIAPYRLEAPYPPGYQPMTWLQYSEYTDWKEVARWAADLFQGSPPGGADFNDLIARLRQTSDREKRAAQALDFVQSEIRYTSIAFGESSHRPSTPDEVLRRRYGDCKDKALLLVSIYRALGLDAHPVLLGLVVRQGMKDWLPAPTPFDHAIVQLRFNGNTYWLDPTAQQKPHSLASIGHLHGGDDALVADAHVDKPVQIEGPHPDLFSVTERVHLDGFDKPATLERAVTFTGTMAEDMRWSISQTPPEQLKKNILNEIQRHYGPAQWSQELTIDDDANANMLTLRERVSLTKYAERIDGGDWILRHRPSMAPFFAMPETAQRTSPYALQFPLEMHFLHEVELPPGVSVSADDVVHELKNPFFHIRQVQRRKGHTASAEYDFETLAPSVPAEQMSRFLTDLRTVQNDFHPSILISASQASGGGAEQGIDSVRAAAGRGDPLAQSKLARMYASGQGATRDYAQALDWYRKAAEQNFAEAQFNLGWMFYRGFGTPQAYDTALVWFRKAAQQNVAAAQYWLGTMYTRGEGVPKDYAQATSWYQKSADQSYPPAQVQLGMLYQAGLGVARDPSTARTWYLKAAQQGDRFAQAALGLMYAQGDGIAKDYNEALAWLRKAADQNDPWAQNGLGWLYENGYGTDKDPAAAAQWYRKAADQSYALAQSNLGRLIYNGKGVPQDHGAAIALWQKAATQNEMSAEFLLGIACETGQGMEQNPAQAAAWYRKAADQGYSRAQNTLGSLYQKGNGVPLDLVQAHMWFNLAASGGDPQAARNRDTVAAQMTSQQVEAAQKLAHEWHPTGQHDIRTP